MSKLQSFYQGTDKGEREQGPRRFLWIVIPVLVLGAVLAVYLAGRMPTSSVTPGQDPYATTIGLHGKEVFVDPSAALSQALIDYADGFAAIRREFKLFPINRFNFRKYKNYGWQLTTGSEEERQQGWQITQFLDIYENSFPEK